ncbi:MAG: hypothetical protein QXL51_00590 [Candidatus Aenigmatarchaeota archaeon]
MSWQIICKPTLNHFQIKHNRKNLEVLVTRRYPGDLRNYDDIDYTKGLAFQVKIGANTYLNIDPDGGHGWSVVSTQEGEETSLISQDELVELIMLIMSNIQPERIENSNQMHESWEENNGTIY